MQHSVVNKLNGREDCFFYFQIDFPIQMNVGGKYISLSSLTENQSLLEINLKHGLLNIM